MQILISGEKFDHWSCMWNFHLYDGLFNKNGSDEEEIKINLINYLENILPNRMLNYTKNKIIKKI